MTTNEMTKKEYLKKYLSGGEKKKKKKKTVQGLANKSKIIDDDIDLKNMKPIDESELEIFDLAEEAPQIAGIVDDRPEEVRLMSEYRGSKKWKIIADEHGIEDVQVKDFDEVVKTGKKSDSQQRGSDSDASPPRKSSKKDLASSPPRKKIKQEVDSDASPPRKSKKAGYDSDASPPRKSKKNHDSNVSPPRRSKKNYESDASPPRKSRKSHDSDASPPRRSRKPAHASDLSPRRSKKIYDSDASPPRRSRKSNHDSDASPPRRHRKNNHAASPPMRIKKEIDSDESPHRSKHRRRNEGPDTSPPRKRSDSRHQEASLSGKKTGLQNSEDMRKELAELRRRQNDAFANMSKDVSGRDAAVVVRDRKTGRRRDLKEEARRKREKEEKEAERLAQYAVWGKGVKQIEDRQEKIKEDLYEMSKPLARYADDKDLDEMLKNEEREGDPMLEYIRKKRKSHGGSKNVKPRYEGAYMPNRYGVRPGYRWDGVDRSNGYEKKWFDEQNARKAREEEAFKWSTADM